MNKTVTLTLPEPMLQAMVGLICAAGSRLGDAQAMRTASDVVAEIERQIAAQAAKSEPEHLRVVGASD